MNINEYKGILENLVHDSLYVINELDEKQNKYLKDMVKYLNECEDYFNDFRILISSKNNENYFAYDTYIEMFLKEAKSEIKIELLSNYENYDDIVKNNETYINVWDTLNNDQKINYLIEKKVFSDLDYLLINNSLKDNNSFIENVLINELINNPKIKDKIVANSIEINCSSQYLNHFDLDNYEQCKILTKESYTALLLKKYNNFNDCIELITKNDIFKLLNKNSLKFNSKYNNDIYEFILKNNNYIGKFSKKYLSLFSIVEITKISKNKDLDADSLCTVIEQLYKYDNDNAMEYFSESNLNKFRKHSIVVFPFHNFKDDYRTKLFNDYSLFNKFIDTIMIEAINNYFSEDDILNLLRNDSFVNDTSSYAMELMLNKLSFKSTFNMLQRKNILSKITNLNVSVNDKDVIFFKGYLESPLLVNKSEHSFIYNMLSLLSNDDVSYFITLPYINNKLSNYEIINLCLDKDIAITEIVYSDTLRNKLNTIDIINFIDGYFEKKLDLNVFSDKEIAKLLFNLTEKQINNIDFSEVNYLFETIRMKSILSKQYSKCTVQSYKAVLAAYLSFGLTKTIKLITDGNSAISLDEVKQLQEYVVNARILEFKQNNSSIFQNMAKKIIEELDEYDKNIDIKVLEKEIRNNTYLDNVLYLMLNNNYDSYNRIIELLYNYVKYRSINDYQAKKEIYDYCKSFSSKYIENKVNEFNLEFENIILSNFKPKENVLYSKRKESGNEYINKLKLKLFIRALTDPDKELYVEFFDEGYELDKIKDKYVKYLSNEDIEFENILEHVLIPLSNGRFDAVNCLNKLDIMKPNSYDEYYRYMEEIRIVTELNLEIEKIHHQNEYTVQEFLSIMNYICYGTRLPFRVKPKVKNSFDKLSNMVKDLEGELYVDKSILRYLYKDNMDIYNIDDIIEYRNYVDILEGIVKKTYKYIDKNMSTENIKQYYAHDYFRAMNTTKCTFPITNRYYEPIKRVFSLKDMEILFNGYDFRTSRKISKSLESFLNKKHNLIMLLDGYYSNLVNNMGVIISKWDNLIKEVKALDINMDDVNLLTIENVLSLESFKDNVLGRSLDKEVIKSICDNSHYEEVNVNKRIDILIDLYQESLSRISSTVPYVSYKQDEYEVNVMNSYNQDILKCFENSIYKVGAIGNDFLHYAILNKNGIVVNIYKDKNMISKVLGIRNGNTVYLNILEGLYDDNYVELMRNFANYLIDYTKDDIEPIEYVTIVNNEYCDNTNGYRLDNTICPSVNNPINVMYLDYDLFKENKNLLNDDIFTNYNNNITTLLANSNVVDKNNFKYYDADAKYLRNRNSVVKLSNNIGEEYLNKINSIMYLWSLENPDEKLDEIILSNVDTIYLGDDFVIFINEDNITKYVLSYDDRVYKEVELIEESLK